MNNMALNEQDIDVSAQDIGFRQVLFFQISNLLKSMGMGDNNSFNNLMIGFHAILRPIADDKFNKNISEINKKILPPQFNRSREYESSYRDIFAQQQRDHLFKKNLAIFEELIALMDRKHLLLDKEGESDF